MTENERKEYATSRIISFLETSVIFISLWVHITDFLRLYIACKTCEIHFLKVHILTSHKVYSIWYLGNASEESLDIPWEMKQSSLKSLYQFLKLSIKIALNITILMSNLLL